MKPLIEIKSIPISIEYKVNAAQLKQKSAMAEVEVSRNRNGLSIKSRPIQVDIDTFEARNSISPSMRTSIKQAADRGMQFAFDATARIAEEGDMMVNIQLQGDPLMEIAASTGMQEKDFNIGFIPDAPPQIDWMPHELNIRYEMDKLNFDWKTGQQNLEFTPASIEFNVLEYAKVIIDYVGGPIYVPPSADPSYVPLDTRA